MDTGTKIRHLPVSLKKGNYFNSENDIQKTFQLNIAKKYFAFNIAHCHPK